MAKHNYEYQAYLDCRDVREYQEKYRPTNRGLVLETGLGDEIQGVFVSPANIPCTERFTINYIKLFVDVVGRLNIVYKDINSNLSATDDYMRNTQAPKGMRIKYDIGDVVWCGRKLSDGRIKRVPCIVTYIIIDEKGVHYELVMHDECRNHRFEDGSYDGWHGTCFSVLEEHLRDSEEEVNEQTPAEGYFGRNGFYD